MDEKEPLGPPELPETEAPADRAPRLQLVRSTQSTKPVPTDGDDEPDELNEHVEEPGDPDGVVAADEEQQWQEAQPAPAAQTRRRRWPKVLSGVLILAAAVAGAYWFGSYKADAPAPANPHHTSSANLPTPSSQTAAVPTKHYDSTNYTLGFDYPEGWTVADNTTKLTVTSPAVKLTGLDGTAVNTHVVITVQNQQATIPGYPATGAVAELDSDKLSYKQPTAVQRAQTYLSYLGYHKENGLDQLFITGDNGYKQGQQVPMTDVAKGNPLISVTFETCSTSDCASGTSALTTLLASAWKNTVSDKQVVALLQSLQLN
jgi:hypothetical protein